MNIDMHSHFFPLQALRDPGKFRDKAPEILLENGRCTIISGGGKRGNLAEGAYDAAARIQALNAMNIDVQALSPSPILLFYRDEPAAAAYFSRKQNEAIQAVADRVVIGTDYPMAMGDLEPVRKIKALNLLSDTERSQILGSNAVRALKLPIICAP